MDPNGSKRLRDLGTGIIVAFASAVSVGWAAYVTHEALQIGVLTERVMHLQRDVDLARDLRALVDYLTRQGGPRAAPPP